MGKGHGSVGVHSRGQKRGILCRRPERSHEIHDENRGALDLCQRGSLGFLLHKVT